VIHRLAEKTGAEAYLLPVPFFANSAEDRDVLLAQRGVAEAIALARQSTLCLVGIGEVDGAEAFLRQSGMISPEEQLALSAAGAVGEVLGCFLDAEGRPIATPLHERLIALPFLDLAGREVYGVAGGSAKVAAIAAVLRARILTGLITDELTARRLLDGGYSSRHPHNEDRGSETWTEKPGTSPAA
jgi:DNA-binding transcriptional regulator LsrR (DeoR family)